MLTREMPTSSGYFDLRALDFGQGQPVTNFTSPEVIGRVGFRIERRLDEPYERNRFLCNAATKTPEHIRILEVIEAAIRNRSS
jgi:hypothetical protein